MLMLCCTFGSSPTPLTSHLDKDFGPLPPIVCLFIVPFPSLVHVYGTIHHHTYLFTMTATAKNASISSVLLRSHLLAVQLCKLSSLCDS